MKKENKKSVISKPITIESFFEERFISDVKTLIKGVQNNNGELPKKVIMIWSELQNEMGAAFGDRELERSISLLSYEIACLYRPEAKNNDHNNFLFVGWCRYAASFKHYKATFDLCLYAIDKELNDEVIAFWSNKAIELLIAELEDTYDSVNKETLIHQANLIIRRVSYKAPKLGLSYTFKLMQAPGVINNHDLKKLANNMTDELVEKIGGIRVLESIEPSGDRSVRVVCEKYEELVKNPVTLVRIGDLSIVEKTLNEEFPWFHQLTNKMISSLQLRLLGNGDFFIPPLLILGDAGIGKTSYSLRFSQLIDVPFRAISLAGKNDNRDLIGTSRGWGTGQPSMIISLINQHKVGNPIVLADEVDKCGGSDHNGRALDSLLTLFEPTSAKHFFDEYLCGRCDFSRVSWICTANSIKQLPNTLLSRLDVVTISNPKFEHYPAIVQRSITTFFTENGIHSAHTPTLEAADWKWLQRYYTSPRVTKRAVYKWLAYRLLSSTNDMVH